MKAISFFLFFISLLLLSCQPGGPAPKGMRDSSGRKSFSPISNTDKKENSERREKIQESNRPQNIASKEKVEVKEVPINPYTRLDAEEEQRRIEAEIKEQKKKPPKQKPQQPQALTTTSTPPIPPPSSPVAATAAIPAVSAVTPEQRAAPREQASQPQASQPQRETRQQQELQEGHDQQNLDQNQNQNQNQNQSQNQYQERVEEVALEMMKKFQDLFTLCENKNSDSRCDLYHKASKIVTSYFKYIPFLGSDYSDLKRSYGYFPTSIWPNNQNWQKVLKKEGPELKNILSFYLKEEKEKPCAYEEGIMLHCVSWVYCLLKKAKAPVPFESDYEFQKIIETLIITYVQLSITDEEVKNNLKKRKLAFATYLKKIPSRWNKNHRLQKAFCSLDYIGQVKTGKETLAGDILQGFDFKTKKKRSHTLMGLGANTGKGCGPQKVGSGEKNKGVCVVHASGPETGMEISWYTSARTLVRSPLAALRPVPAEEQEKCLRDLDLL